MSDQSDPATSKPITCILSDVDGVMTDGRIIYDNACVETKRFHVHDGLAIKLWMKSGFQFGILTARTSQIVSHRASELNIEHVQQGYEQKGDEAKKMIAAMGCQLDQVCYIGDDLPDLPVMQMVGLAAAPADAATDVLSRANWVMNKRGGEGVLRELIERLLRSKNRWEEHLP